MAEQPADATRRLIFSFYDFYGKGQGRLHAALQGTGIHLEDIAAVGKADERDPAAGIQDGCRSERLAPLLVQRDSTVFHRHRARRLHRGHLIGQLFGGDPSNNKDKNQRQACGCVESVDMGSYNTCHFRCTYCYANFNEAMIASNGQKHFPDNPFLLGRYEGEVVIQTGLKKKKCAGGQQLEFF